MIAGEAEINPYAELDETTKDLIKVRNWIPKIKERDVFGASGRKACAEMDHATGDGAAAAPARPRPNAQPLSG